MRADELALTTERQNIAGLLSLQAEIVKILSEINPTYHERLSTAAEPLFKD